MQLPDWLMTSYDWFHRVVNPLWVQPLGRKEFAKPYLDGLWLLHSEVESTAAQMRGVLDHNAIEPLHRRMAHKVVLRLSQMEHIDELYLRFGPHRARWGAPGYYPYNKVFVFGERLFEGWYAFPIPEDFPVTAGLLTDRLGQPALGWSHGVDFWIDTAGRRLLVRHNPFTLEPFIQHKDGTDVVIDAWVLFPRYDHQIVTNTLGGLFGLTVDSSQRTLAFCKKLYKALRSGCSSGLFMGALGDLMGLPLPEVSAQVTAVIATYSYIYVITTKEVLAFPQQAELNVQAGDYVQAGQGICSELRLVQSTDSVPAINLDASVLAAPVRRSITFLNQPVVVRIAGYDEQDRPLVEWDLVGDPPDVAAYWSHVRSIEASSGQNLADLLWTGAVPATVNPMQVIVDSLHYNTKFITMSLKPWMGQTDTNLLPALLNLVDAHIGVWINLELEMPPDAVVMHPDFEDDPSFDDEYAGEVVDSVNPNASGEILLLGEN